MVTALYCFFLRTLVTRGRIVALGALGLVAAGLGLAIGLSEVDRPVNVTFGFISNYGLAGLAPVTALVFGSAVFGDLIDDQTLVHVWLRPVARWRLAASAYAAVLSVVVPLVVVPLTVAAALCRTGASVIVGTAIASILAVAAYSALFCWLGLRLSRALVWGLVYILIWEGAIANVAAGLARFALRLYTRSILGSFTGGEVTVDFGVTRVVAVAVPIVVATFAMLMTVRRLRRTDVA